MTDVIFVEEHPAKGKEHHALPGSIVGRDNCDILLPDPEISRRHAAVRQVDEDVAIEDLESKNGTFVNGERVTGIKRLKHGDGVRFGNTVLRVSAPRA